MMWLPTVTVNVVLLVLVIWCDDALTVAGRITNSSFAFRSFPSADPKIVTIDDVYYNSYSSSYDLNFDFMEHCARIVHSDKVQLKDKVTGTVASFSASFTFAFRSYKNKSDGCGEGMTFSFVGALSLSSVEGRRTMCSYDYAPHYTDRYFVVKFGSMLMYSTSTNMADPSDSTIGVMVTDNGKLLTIPQHNLCASSLYTDECVYFCGTVGTYSAWIDYDGRTKTLEVFFRSGTLDTGGKPFTPVITVPNLSLGGVLDDEMYVALTGKTYWLSINPETHKVYAWNFNSSDPTPAGAPNPSPEPPLRVSRDPGPDSQLGLVIGVSTAVVLAICGVLGFCCYMFVYRTYRNKDTSENRQEGTSVDLKDPSSRPYSFDELAAMTDSFASSELLSSGAFGDVFKGTPPSGTLVAVKRIKQQNGHAIQSFQAEANSLRQIRHRNLLHLRGWCQSKQGLFLVYDYMTNLSLDKWLHRDGTEAVFDSGLSWNVRHHILAGVAAGLTYLHEDLVQCVLHRDIKSSNVLLDGDFNAHLGDFGLARLVDHEKVQKTTLMAGTLGYMAPELHYSGRASKETDVYAFGILVLETVSGRRPLQVRPGVDPEDYVLLDRVWRAHEAGNISTVVDPKLNIQLSDVYQWMSTVGRVLQMGLLCCLPNPSERPSMRVVNQWFQAWEAGALVNLPQLPVTRPGPVAQYPLPPPSQGGTSSSDFTWASDKVAHE